MVFRPIEQLADGSFLAKVYPSNWYRENDKRGIVVRVIEYKLNDPQRIGHDKVHRLMTTLTDSDAYPAEEIGIDVDRLSFTSCFQIIKVRLSECRDTEAANLSQWYNLLKKELREEMIGPRRNRTNPRVIKRKMSRWLKKRPQHRKPKPLTKTFVESIVMKK